MKEKNKVVNALLDKGEAFYMKTRFGKRKFVIKPLVLGTLIAISESCNNVEIDESDTEPMQVIAKYSKYSKEMARIVALAVLNNKLKIKLFSSYLTNYFLWKLSPGELYKLMMLSIKQMEVTDFFGCTALLGAMNITKERSKAGELKETKPCGEVSPGQ